MTQPKFTLHTQRRRRRDDEGLPKFVGWLIFLVSLYFIVAAAKPFVTAWAARLGQAVWP